MFATRARSETLATQAMRYKSAFSGAVKSGIISNQELAEELSKPIIKKFEQRKVYSSFKDNI